VSNEQVSKKNSSSVMRAGSAGQSVANAKPQPKWLILVCVILIPLAIYALSGADKKRVENERYDSGAITYSGSLINGKFTGDGKLAFENGDIYTGGFFEGRFNGRGNYISNEGWQLEGIFSNGQINGESAVFTPNR
jgi:hypothetical protein